MKLTKSLKSIGKMLLLSRRCTGGGAVQQGIPLIIMGNGPSLADAIRDNSHELRSSMLMAVNLAANTDEFLKLRPQLYVLADPGLFKSMEIEGVRRLWESLNERVNWPMTLYVPARSRFLVDALLHNPLITVATFNPVGVEGWEWLCHGAYRMGWGMPRPRNVLIPAIMIGLKAGYKEIWLTGADHSWLRTLDVDDQNRVVSVQPHFYKDNEAEQKRVTQLFSNMPLHELLMSFHITFKGYHQIRRYADRIGAHIYNATPGSFIDAFERRKLSEVGQ